MKGDSVPAGHGADAFPAIRHQTTLHFNFVKIEV